DHLGEDCDARARAREVGLYPASAFLDQSHEFLRPHHSGCLAGCRRTPATGRRHGRVFLLSICPGSGFRHDCHRRAIRMYAKQAMAAAGTSQMTDAFRAVGLQSAMALVVPVTIALTCISLFFAARSFIADAGKTASVGKPVGGLATASCTQRPSPARTRSRCERPSMIRKRESGSTDQDASSACARA